MNTKRIGLLCLLLLLSMTGLQAKKVKFMVNMTGVTKNVTGIHCTGDFQTVAGYLGGDFNSATTVMTQEPGDTNLYGVVVDIPAFTKYEYKFVNGDQFYEVEFVPLVSRVGYNFNDNRWIYIDSLDADTMVIGPLMFGGNAPAGYRAARFVVDMQLEASVAPEGVHVAGAWQGWDPQSMYMYSFVPGVYEHIGFLDSLAPTTTFNYYNGNTLATLESLVGTCGTNGQRSLSLPMDTILPTVCFGYCADCATVGVTPAWTPRVSVYPNPAGEQALVRLDNHFGAWSLTLRDVRGQLLRTQAGVGEQAVTLAREGLASGVYFVTVTAEGGLTTTQKFVFR